MILEFFKNTASTVRSINQKYSKPQIKMTPKGEVLPLVAPAVFDISGGDPGLQVHYDAALSS